MNNTSESNEFTLREAVESDIPRLSKHHSLMFEEIWEKTSRAIGEAKGAELENEYAEKLKQEMPAGVCKSWVFEKNNEIAASGAISIVNLVSTPDDHSSRVAYLHTMYTEPQYRGNHLAGMIVQKAIGYCKSIGLKRIFLVASDAGKPVYEKIGFVSSPETMRYFIK
ncbi:MAG: GNAT family N-acetyltransferase [bacterium]